MATLHTFSPAHPRLPVAALVLVVSAAAVAQERPTARPTPTEVVEASAPSEWRPLQPDNAVYLELDGGRVILELAPDFAPKHVQRIKELAASGFYDGLPFYRVVEGFVAQAGVGAEEPEAVSPPPLPAEFERPIDTTIPFTSLGAPDGYAAEVGYSRGFPAARNGADGAAWLVHCPGTVAMARDEAPASGSTEFYVVLGHAPRYLDRNLSVFGRVVAGMEHLQRLPRGSDGSGMIDDPEARGTIRSLRLAADVPEVDRTRLEILSTESDSFRRLIEARRNRPETFFVNRSDHIDVCGVPIPVRSPNLADASAEPSE